MHKNIDQYVHLRKIKPEKSAHISDSGLQKFTRMSCKHLTAGVIFLKHQSVTHSPFRNCSRACFPLGGRD